MNNSLRVAAAWNASRSADTRDHAQRSAGQVVASGGARLALMNSTQSPAASFQSRGATCHPFNLSSASRVPGPATSRATGATSSHPTLNIKRDPIFMWRQLLPDGEERWIPDTDGAPDSRDMLPGDVEIIGGGPWISAQVCAQALAENQARDAGKNIEKDKEEDEEDDHDETPPVATSGPRVHNEHNNPTSQSSLHFAESQWTHEQREALTLQPYGGETPDDAAGHSVAGPSTSRRQARDDNSQYCIFCGKSHVGRGGHNMWRHWGACRAFEHLATNEMLGPWIAANLRAFRRRDLCQIYGGGPGSPALTPDGTFCVRNVKYKATPEKRHGMLEAYTPPQSAVRH